MFTKLKALAVAVAVVAPAAFAQTAGSWTGSVGFTSLQPSVQSGNLSAPSLPNTQSAVNSNTQLTGAINYMYTDNIALSVPLGFGFSNNISGAGAIAGVGTIATTQSLPLTVLGQYRFMDANAQWRPYLGAGLSYVKFYNTNGTGALTSMTNPGSSTPTTISLQNKLAATLQAGAVINVNEKWYVDLNYTKTFLSTTATLSTGQTQSIQLNPNGYTIGVGYKF